MVSSSTLSKGEALILYPPVRTSTINLTVIIDSTFDQTIDFEDLLADYETIYSSRSLLYYRGNYLLDLEYRYLTNQEHNKLITYLQSTKNVSGSNGYEINTSATIAEASEEFLIEKGGVAFNATDTILWLADNLWNQKKNEYSLFLFNLTEFDIESGLHHWWLYEPYNIDTHSVPLEFSYFAGAIQYSQPYGHQVPAWGGWRYPIHFIDFSAEHWMGDFLRFVNESPFFWYMPTSVFNHLLKNLSDFGTPVNVSDVNFLSWLESWVKDFIIGIYRESVMGNYIKIADTVSAQTLVINNWSTHLDNNEISWLIHDDLIDAEFSRAFPWIEFEVTTTWKFLSDFPGLEEEIAKCIVYDTYDGKLEIEISTLLATYCRQTLFPSIFDYTAADLVLPSLILLFDNMSLTHSGDRFHGFSFGWGQIMGEESTFFYRKDGVTQDSGLSWLILHEVGHSLGLSHPFDSWTTSGYYEPEWGSMFTSTLMTYCHAVPEFSIYDTNAIGHATSDYYLAPAEWCASELKKFSEVNSSTPYLDALTLLHQAQDAQKSWNYSSAILLAKEAFASLKDLYESATSTPPSSTTTTTTTATPPSSTTTTTTTATPSWSVFLWLLSLFIMLPMRRRKKKS